MVQAAVTTRGQALMSVLFFFSFFTYYLLFTVYISALVTNKDIYKC